MDNNNNIIDYIEPVNNETNYWLVRTMGGDYYKEYVESNFIAIGYNEITVDDLLHLPTNEKLAKKSLQEMIKSKYESIRNVSYPSSQMYRFAHEMKEGDIVIVPSSSSHMVTFGIIDSDIYEESEQLHATYACPFSKRRAVKWLKTTPRYKLPADLLLMFNSRHIISEITSYASFIDTFLNDFYVKGDTTYLVLRVKQEGTLTADDFTLINDLMELFNDFSKKHGLGLTSKDIKMKMSVHSPGDIIAFCTSPLGIMTIGLFVMFIKGGHYSIKWLGLDADIPKLSQSIATIIRAVNEFLNDHTKRKIVNQLSKKMDNMEIDTPTSIIDIMKQLNQTNHPSKTDED